MKCGLLGRKLGHSYSPQIHSYLADYSYELFEREPEEVGDFLKNGDFAGINVTMPYKQAVIPYLDECSPLARRLGAVNTVVRRNGKLIGHNTDYFGFISMAARSGLQPAGKKCLVLGSGGVSKPAVAALEEMGANVVIISHKENTPETLAKHSDAAIIVNATPVGMFPNVDASPVDLDFFPVLEGVLDLIFNPARTELMLQAERRGLVAMGGLWMLVAQAKEASEWFLNSPISDEMIGKIHSILRTQMENVILIGMPGCGKSTVGAALAEMTGRKLVDADAAITEKAGKTIPEIFAQDGEDAFRSIETEVLAELGKQSGLIIATGGGCVTRSRNYPLLHRNGSIFWLRRDLDALPTEGRPLSQQNDLADMYRVRKPMYEMFADHTVDNHGTPSDAACKIMQMMEVIR